MMLHLFNTATRQTEAFTAGGDRVGVYVCGITPLDDTDLEQAFAYVHFDVLVRYLRDRGRRVVYVQNLTDLDDSLLERAAVLKIGWEELSERHTYRFLSEMHRLGNLPPTIFPRTTDLIASMVDHIAGLLQAGWAYQRGGNIYFAAGAYPGLGRLSRLPTGSWLAAARRCGHQAGDPLKKDPLDFVLWQSTTAGEPEWPSPWGKGRPGPHVQCSAMAMKFLGPQIDIIGGRAELIFPHHEFLLAQLECLRGRSFSPLWVHAGQENLQGRGMKEKILLEEFRHFNGAALRLALLDHHHGSELDFDQRGLRMAVESAHLFRQALRRNKGRGSRIDSKEFQQRFAAAMDADLNTPGALKILRTLAIEIMQDGSRDADQAQASLNHCLRVLGVELDPDSTR